MPWNFWRRGGTPEVAREVRDELDTHLTMRIADNERHGLSPEEAAREARQRLGALPAFADASTRIRGRRSSLRRELVGELRHASRSLRRSPRLATCGAIVAATGLATALAAAVVADALLLRAPAGIRNAATLRSALFAHDGENPTLMSYEVLRAIEGRVPEARPFAWGQRDLQVIHGTFARAWTGELVSGWYFEALGVRSTAGRLIVPDDLGARSPVAVVSARLVRAIGGDPHAVVGGTLTVNGTTVRVIGVAERDFRGVQAGQPADLWLPVTLEPEISTVSTFPDGRRVRGFLSTTGIGWMRGGVRLPRDPNPTVITDRLSASVRAGVTGYKDDARRAIVLRPQPWLSPFGGERERLDAVIAPIGWTVALTLALTAICLASLFAGRLADRQREVAICVALGAGWRRVVTWAAFEVALVCAAGALLALPATIAVLAAAGRFQLAPGIVVADAVPPIDLRAIGWLAGFAIVVSISASMAPLALARRLSMRTAPVASRTTASGRGVRRVLMAGQVAVGCGLLAGSLMLTRTLTALLAQPIGYDASAVAFAEFSPAGAGLDDGQRVQLLERLQPDADSRLLAMADEAPYAGQTALFTKGISAAVDQETATFATRIAGPYFETLGIPIVAGRRFASSDAGRSVAIISAPLSEWYWPGANAVGRIIRVGGDRGVNHEVIGVVPGLRDRGLRGQPTPRVYLPLDADTETLTVVARSANTGATAASLAETVRSLDTRLVPLRSGSLASLMRRTIEQRRMLRLLTAVVGTGSLALIAVGVWGLAASSLRRRWREFGVRQALGATGGQVARLALTDLWFVAGIGGLVGLGCAWQFGRLLQAWLFGVTPYDPWSIAPALLVVLIAAAAGAAWPARQAARIDAATLLRNE